MAHYRFIALFKPDNAHANHSITLRDDLSEVDGFIYDGKVISLDMFRWLLPGVSEETRQEAFQKILVKKLREAEDAGFLACFVDEHE